MAYGLSLPAHYLKNLKIFMFMCYRGAYINLLCCIQYTTYVCRNKKLMLQLDSNPCQIEFRVRRVIIEQRRAAY